MNLLNQVVEAVESGLVDDMNELSSGGSGRGLLPQGEAFIRMSMYVEFGVQKLPAFQGKPKAPHMTFKMGAHIVGGGGVNQAGDREMYILEEGKFPFIATFETPLYRNEKAKATKWFAALNTTGKMTTIAQSLGQTYIVPIKIVPSKKDPKRMVNQIDWDKARAAIDPISMQAYDLPTLPNEAYKLLLWQHPTLEQWASIYQEGVWEAKDGRPAESKNKLQETCLRANDFVGSSLEQLLANSEGGIPDIPTLVDDTADAGDAESALPEPTDEPVVPSI